MTAVILILDNPCEQGVKMYWDMWQNLQVRSCSLKIGNDQVWIPFDTLARSSKDPLIINGHRYERLDKIPANLITSMILSASRESLRKMRGIMQKKPEYSLPYLKMMPTALEKNLCRLCFMWPTQTHYCRKCYEIITAGIVYKIWLLQIIVSRHSRDLVGSVQTTFIGVIGSLWRP